MQVYLVISYDGDEQQSMWDHVAAKDHAEAGEIAGKLRGDYAVVVDVLSVENLEEGLTLLKERTVDQAKAAMASLAVAQDKCPQCYEDVRDCLCDFAHGFDADGKRIVGEEG